MDKELLRVIIIAIGLLVILGIVLWSYLKNRNAEPAAGSPRGRGGKDKNRVHGQADKPTESQNDSEHYAIVPEKAATFDEPISPVELVAASSSGEENIRYADDDNDTAPRFVVPDIIQFSLNAKPGQSFNGLDLANAFNIVHMIYGSLKIYERLDANRLVDFGVASMARPGTFPDPNNNTGSLESYTSPGLVFFMQPNMLDNPQAVFDDFTDTLHLLAVELDGEMLDQENNPLTEETIRLFRQSL